MLSKVKKADGLALEMLHGFAAAFGKFCQGGPTPAISHRQAG